MPNPTEYLEQIQAEAAEQKKTARKAKRQAKVARSKALLDTLPWEERDDLVGREFRLMCRLPLWKQKLSFVRPALKVRRSKNKGFSGQCKAWSNEITVTIGTDVDRATICELLLHELAHAAAGAGEGHGTRFRSILTQAVDEYCGARVKETPAARVYDYDTQLTAAMREKFPASIRAVYREELERKKRERARCRNRSPEGFPGEIAVRLTPTATATLDNLAREPFGKEEEQWLHRRVVGRWTFATRAAWNYALERLEHQLVLVESEPEFFYVRQRQSIEKSIIRIKEGLA